MTRDDSGDLDAHIESALAGEPMRQPPSHLHRTICQRVRVTAVLERERRRLRYQTAAGTALLCAVGLSAVVLVVVADAIGWLPYHLPGGLDSLDYWTSSMGRSLGHLTPLALLWAGAPVGCMSLYALSHFCKRLVAHKTH